MKPEFGLCNRTQLQIRPTADRYHRPGSNQPYKTHTQEQTVCSCVGDEQAEPQALTLTRCSAACLVTGCVTISTLRQTLTASYRPHRLVLFTSLTFHSTAQHFSLPARQLSKSFSYKYWSHSQIRLKHRTTTIFHSVFDCQLSAEPLRRLTKYFR